MSRLLPIEVGKSITKGTNPDRKILQDRISVPDPSPFKIGLNQQIHIFDGHGERGEEAAEIAKNVFFNEREDTPADQLSDLFYQAHDQIAAKPHLRGGGTTASAVDITYDISGTQTIHTAWVGDSPVFLVHPDIDKLRADRIVPLTPSLHNTDNVEEVARTQALGVEIYDQRFGKYYPHPFNPELVHHIGLAVSRSLGDIDISRIAGTIPRPYVLKHVTEPERQKGHLVIAGSDGVFHNDNELHVIANILMHYEYSKSLQKTAEYITRTMAKVSGDDSTLAIAQLRDTRKK